MLKSKSYLIVAVLCILALLTGCGQSKPPEKPRGDGTIIIYVTDAPSWEEVTSIMVTLSEVQLHKASNEAEPPGADDQNGGGEWITINISGNATFDLLQIQGVEQFLGRGEVEAAKYTQVRMVIDAVQVRIGTGNLTEATLPDKELKIVQPFNVTKGKTTELVLDFEAGKMVTFPGVAETMLATTAGEGVKAIVEPVVQLIVRQES